MRSVDLRLPDVERQRAGELVGAWTDLLYVPGPHFTSPLDPGVYRSTFFVVPPEGQTIRLSSRPAPAFGGDLCRLRLEPVASVRRDRLGSFFEPSRRGAVYAMGPDAPGGFQPADRPGWAYEGPPLVRALGVVTRVRILRERGRGGPPGDPFAWEADRGLVVSGPDGDDHLFLAQPDGDDAILTGAAGPYRALLDPRAPVAPGASVRELLGYGGWADPLEVTVELVRVPAAGWP